MIKTRLISCILSFAVLVTALPAAASAGSTEVSSVINAFVDDNGEIVSNNMKVYMGDNNLNNFSVKGGKKGWLFDVVSSKTDNYLYMDIEDSLADRIDKGRIIEVEVEYFDAGKASFAVEYTNREGKSAETPYKEFEGSLTWKTHKFVISDALLDNGINGSDMRLSSKTKKMATSVDSFTVKAVRVNLTDKLNQLTINATTEKYGNNFFTGEEIKFKYIIDNKLYPLESHKKGIYTVDASFSVKNIEGELMFTSEGSMELEPGKPREYDLTVDVGGKYGVYFITAVFKNDELGVYSEDTTRFSYVRTDYGKTINSAYGLCSGRRLEFVPLFKNAGIGRVRVMNAFANVSAHQPGERAAYFYPAISYSLQRSLREQNIGVFSNYLAVSGEFAKGEHAPHTEEGMQNFLDYANYMTEQERYGVDSYDMWNEWNLLGSSFNRYARPIEDYIEFMKKTYTEMKSQYPDLMFWGGVTSGVDLNWLETILKNGGGDYMDGYCVHAYKIQDDPMSGGGVELVWGVRELLDKYGYPDMPIVATELGFVDDTFYGIDELKQGYYLIEYYIALKKVPHFTEYTQYIFQDAGVIKGNREQHWGLIEFTGSKTPGAAKASYPMISNMNLMLAGYEYMDDITINDDTYAYRMHSTEKNDDVIILWARGNGGTVAVNLGTDEVELYDTYGNMSTLTGVNGVFSFALNEAPIYVKGDITKFEESKESIISKNDFDIEFSRDASFTISNPLGKNLNIEIKPRDNDDLKFTVTENADNSINVFADTARTKSYRDLASIKITDEENNKYLDGMLIFEYSTPINTEMACEPMKNADGSFDYSNTSLNIKLSNTGTSNISGKFLINSLEGASDYKSEYTGISLAPGDEQTISLSVSSDVSRFNADTTFVTDDNISVDFSTATSYAVCDYAYTKPTIDGTIAEGEYSKKTYLNPDDVLDILAVDQYQGADDYSANLSYAWDEDNLYIAMECIDNTLFIESPAASSMWRYDSFQFAAVYDPDEKYDSSQLVSVLYGQTGGKPTLEMVVNNALNKMNDPKYGFEGAISRNGNSTCYELKVPWNTILMEEREVLPDTVLKFAALANDNDGLGRKAAIQYGEGIYGGSKSSDMFIKMYLVKEGEQQ